MAVRRNHIKRSLKRTATSQRGVTAIEFALVSPVVIILMFAIFEIATMSLTQIRMNTAVSEAGREVRTGTVQTAPNPSKAFEDTLCSTLGAIVTCDAIEYRIETYASYADIPETVQLTSDGSLADPGYASSGPREIVMIRATHAYSFAVPFLGRLMSETNRSTRLLAATTVLTNEPFEDKFKK